MYQISASQFKLYTKAPVKYEEYVEITKENKERKREINRQGLQNLKNS